MTPATQQELKAFLDLKARQYNQPGFIPDDPISIPHRFTLLQDREIMGLLAAVLAWGQRQTVVRNCLSLAEWMDNTPYAFVQHHSAEDLRRMERFVHRTFNSTDLLYFIAFFQWFYQRYPSLEHAFADFLPPDAPNTEQALIGFHDLFFSLPYAPERTRKHVATPLRKSACKRLNMFLRWMVRKDQSGVDFGLWNQISPAQLVCPLDVHVERVARRLGLLTRPQTDWQAALELTEKLRELDPNDPVKYDFALFGIGLDDFRLT